MSNAWLANRVPTTSRFDRSRALAVPDPLNDLLEAATNDAESIRHPPRSTAGELVGMNGTGLRTNLVTILLGMILFFLSRSAGPPSMAASRDDLGLGIDPDLITDGLGTDGRLGWW